MIEIPCGTAESVRIKDHARGTDADGGTGNSSKEAKTDKETHGEFESSSEIY
jgi:hypothetical protein